MLLQNISLILPLLLATTQVEASPLQTDFIASSTSSRGSTPTLLARQNTPTTTTPPQADNVYFLSTQYIVIDGFTNAHATNPAKTITLALPTCVQTITPDKNGYVPPGTCNALYNYYPSFAAAIVTALLFGVLSIAHIVLAAKHKMVCKCTLAMRMCWALFQELGLTFFNTELLLGHHHGLVVGDVWLSDPCSLDSTTTKYRSRPRISAVRSFGASV